MGKELERVDEGRRQFVANVSHEFQSPLTLIQGFAKILAEQELSPGERAHYAGIIGDESHRLSVLGKQLLLLSTLEQGREALQRNLFSLKTQIRQAVQVFQWQIEEKALLVKLSVPEAIRLHGDEVLFMQVWTNLIGNAVKYIPAGRTVDIRAEQMAGGGSRVLIRDNGDGIAPEHLPFLFDRFYKADAARERDAGGTGLGLSIAAKIVRLHNGTIEVSSSPEGTLFTITLPNL
jgi:signal transduction histidine kinase